METTEEQSTRVQERSVNPSEGKNAGDAQLLLRALSFTKAGQKYTRFAREKVQRYRLFTFTTNPCLPSPCKRSIKRVASCSELKIPKCTLK
jgi:hypothetical protein